MRIAICDDEKSAAEGLRDMLKEAPYCVETDLYTGGEEFLEAEKSYDLLFLDIDMQGMDGIETARRIRKKDKKLKIVYVTAYPEYGGKAFSVHAFGYLLKPVKKEKLLEQIRDAREYQEEEIRDSVPLEFQTLEGDVFLRPEEIFYFEFFNRKIRLVSRDGTFHMKGRIGDIRKEMEAYGFAAPHKSFVVNLDQIRNIRGYEILLTNQEVLPLSQKQAAGFKTVLSRYLADRRKTV